MSVLALVIRDADDHGQVAAVVSQRPQHRYEATATTEYDDRSIRR